MIEKLHLESFKGFRDFTLECGPLTVLVGLNNGGKTSILQAVQFLNDVIRYAFGGQDKPDFGSVMWESNPSYGITRLAPGDLDAIWWQKDLTHPCTIRAVFSEDVEVVLSVPGRQRYSLDVLKSGTSIRPTIGEPNTRAIIEHLFRLNPTLVPSAGSTSTTERFLHYQECVTFLPYPFTSTKTASTPLSTQAHHHRRPRAKATA